MIYECDLCSKNKQEFAEDIMMIFISLYAAWVSHDKAGCH